MGTLTPGATYIYQHHDGVIYAREQGTDDATRIIGWTHELADPEVSDPRTPDGRPLIEHLRESQIWGEIRRMARVDTAMQALLDRVLLYYNLKKSNDR